MNIHEQIRNAYAIFDQYVRTDDENLITEEVIRWMDIGEVYNDIHNIHRDMLLDIERGIPLDYGLINVMLKKCSRDLKKFKMT